MGVVVEDNGVVASVVVGTNGVVVDVDVDVDVDDDDDADDDDDVSAGSTQNPFTLL